MARIGKFERRTGLWPARYIQMDVKKSQEIKNSSGGKPVQI